MEISTRSENKMNNANFAHKNIDKGKTMQRIPRWRTIIKTSLSKKKRV